MNRPAHFEPGPSKLDAAIGCPATVKASAGIADTSSPEAEHGTRLHSFLEICVKTGKYPKDFPTSDEWAVYSDDDREAVTAVIDYFRDLLIEHPGDILVEHRVDLSSFYPGMFGSLDLGIVGRSLVVTDAKFGRNVVRATTAQMKAYAVGLIVEYEFLDFDSVVCCIAQPFANHFESVTYSVDELLTWARDVMVPAVTESLSDSPRYNPNEVSCKYCRARGTCKARIAAHYETVAAALDNVTAPASEHLTDAEIGAILARADAFEAVINDMKAHAIKTIAKGGTIPGMKLVEGRSLRKWANPGETITVLIDEIQRKRPDLASLDAAELVTKVEPIGISAAEKLIGKTNPIFSSLTVKPQGKATLAPESDTRPAFVPNADVLDALDNVEI